MAFSLTSKQVELRGSWLVALVQQPDASWAFSKLNLNEHIGNKDGGFDATMGWWYHTALEWSCRLRGPFLYARLKTTVGEWSPETCINLDLFVKNRDGGLEFQKLSDSLLLHTACLTLEDNKILKGLVVGPDGKFRVSEINLDQHYGNIGGKFEPASGVYSLSGRDFRLEKNLDSIKLIGELQDYGGVHRPAEIDLSLCVVNRNGQLAFCKPDETPNREHWKTAIAEQIPVLGSAVAGLHYPQESDNEVSPHPFPPSILSLCHECRVADAYRANQNNFFYEIASRTNSATVTVGIALGAFIGRACGSPALGMVIGAGLSTTPGIFLEDRFVNAVEDPAARSQIREAMLGNYVFETLRDMVAADHASAAAELLGASLDPKIDEWMNGLAAWLEKQQLKLLVDFSVEGMVKKVFAKLKGESVEEWDTALAQLTTIQSRGTTLDLKPEDPPIIIVEEAATPAVEQPEEAVAASVAASVANEAVEAAKEPATNGEAPTTNGEATANAVNKTTTTPASSSARTSKTDLKGGSDKDKSSVRGTAPCSNKGWQSVIGISMWRRGWSRSKQQRVI
ncbi:CNVH-domain-containing protein [Hypomontagnella monticulosa]|nr:CNVH-domain-containing protein [Hypomontagnella monticulosa]